LVEDRYKHANKIYRNPGDSIEGDAILLYCRKPGKWASKIRAAEGHHYYSTQGKMNALAILKRTFKNLQK
jgi:hypothetical protein